jgi:tetratricopeptide (TPR) repeat protein
MSEQETLSTLTAFWQKTGKKLSIVVGAIVVIVLGYFAYGSYIQNPKELKASEELFTAENYFRKDSFNLALNGSGNVPGFLKVISKYDGTKSANLAKLYAGICLLKTGQYQKAIEQLEDFDSKGSNQVEAKAEGLLGDAYSELKKNEEAFNHYKNAGNLFPEDQAISSEYLFRAALLSEVMGKNEQAVELYQVVKDKYPRTEKGFVVDKYLARLGAVK